MINVRAATYTDEPRWRELWAGYNAFYEAKIPESITQATCRRIQDPPPGCLSNRLGDFRLVEGVVTGP